MVKYFETLIKHPQTKQEVLVYGKAVIEDTKELTCFVVYPGEYPFILKREMNTKLVHALDEIQKRFYVQQVDYCLNLFK